TGLGIRLEKFMWGSWTPAKLKMAVSGCPRNCAEATCKDIGVICVDSGYEIHFAGAAGLEVLKTEILCNVTTEDEALEVIVALVQYYRETGHYLERIWKWTRRIGQDAITAHVVDDLDARKALFDRFVFSQKFAQTDPWEARVKGKHAHEFAPMAEIATLEAAE
ncbi:MAG: nitrite reductase large subunit, partial [Pseudomonadota bacterium]